MAFTYYLFKSVAGKRAAKMSLLLFPVFVFFLLTLAGCKNAVQKEGKAGPGKQTIRAEAFIVKTAPLQINYHSSGNLLANENVNVFAETPGRITKIFFREGTHVHKGDLLVQLYDEDIRAQLQKLKAQKALQLTTRDRQKQLLDISGISRQDFDQTVTQIASIDADIAYNEAQLRKLQIRAPFSGVIGLRNVSVGAVVTTSTLISTIQQLDPLKMDFAVPEQYNNLMKAGDQVYFTVTGNRDTLSGKIAAIQPTADANTRTITVRAVISNADEHLVPGAFANVFIPLSENKNAITIPSQCVIPTTRDKQVALVKNGKAKMVTVTTGTRLVNNIEITHGLQPGDTVLTTGIMQVKPGMDVTVTKIVE